MPRCRHGTVISYLRPLTFEQQSNSTWFLSQTKMCLPNSKKNSPNFSATVWCLKPYFDLLWPWCMCSCIHDWQQNWNPEKKLRKCHSSFHCAGPDRARASKTGLNNWNRCQCITTNMFESYKCFAYIEEFVQATSKIRRRKDEVRSWWKKLTAWCLHGSSVAQGHVKSSCKPYLKTAT